MTDDTMTRNDGPADSRPAETPSEGMPGESPLADAPRPEAPDLEARSTEPAGDAPGEDPSAAAAEAAPEGDEQSDRQRDDRRRDDRRRDDRGRGSRRGSREEADDFRRVRRRFAACNRCGYFFADCILLAGEEAVREAAADCDDGWLRLETSEAVRPLLSRAYGIRLDIAAPYFAGLCPECRRPFTYSEADDGRVDLAIHC